MSNVMRRVALEDPLSEEEQGEVEELANTCSLYVIINAAFAKAEREGLALSLNLRRPGIKSGRKARARA
jgi:hypothetical protein